MTNPTTELDDERKAFESFVADRYWTTDHSFVRDPYGYVHTVGHRTRPITYAAVQMLWEAWRARAAIDAARQLPHPNEPSGLTAETGGGAYNGEREVAMRPSLHAMRRWGEMFGDYSLEAEFKMARPAGKATKRRIRRQCPVRYRSQWSERGVYYLRSPAGAVFVVAPGEFVVDVFPLVKENGDERG